MPHDLASLTFATQARIVTPRATDAELLKLSGLDAAQNPFFWPAEISSDRIDAYFTRMDAATTLPNFAADAAQGVAFLAGHNHRSLPFGQTLTGVIEMDGDVTRVLVDSYTIPGLDMSGLRTDEFIRAVNARIIRDVSVGFHGGQWICSVCGRDMLTDWWECWHVPGLSYEIKDASGTSTTVRELLCTATIANARLSEVSAVYDGATPGAAILIAERAAEAGTLDNRQVHLLEQRYRMRLPAKRLTVRGSGPIEEQMSQTPPAAPAAALPAPELATLPAEPAADVRELVATPADAMTDRISLSMADVRSLVDVAEDADAETVLAALRTLRVQAADGRDYRESLMRTALAEGVRALGERFDQDRYERMLGQMTLAQIRGMTEDWQALAAPHFPAGRQTRDDAAPLAPAAAPTGDTPARRIPPAAYAG